MPDTLKPCPFCGGEAMLVNMGHGAFPYYIACKDCNSSSGNWEMPQMAIDAWNRRVGHEPAGECAERGSWCGEEGGKG